MDPHQGNKPKLLTLAKQEMEQKAQREQTEGDSRSTGNKTDHESPALQNEQDSNSSHLPYV